jgi:hypothetical protein
MEATWIYRFHSSHADVKEFLTAKKLYCHVNKSWPKLVGPGCIKNSKKQADDPTLCLFFVPKFLYQTAFP